MRQKFEHKWSLADCPVRISDNGSKKPESFLLFCPDVQLQGSQYFFFESLFVGVNPAMATLLRSCVRKWKRFSYMQIERKKFLGTRRIFRLLGLSVEVWMQYSRDRKKMRERAVAFCAHKWVEKTQARRCEKNAMAAVFSRWKKYTQEMVFAKEKTQAWVVQQWKTFVAVKKFKKRWCLRKDRKRRRETGKVVRGRRGEKILFKRAEREFRAEYWLKSRVFRWLRVAARARKARQKFLLKDVFMAWRCTSRRESVCVPVPVSEAKTLGKLLMFTSHIALVIDQYLTDEEPVNHELRKISAHVFNVVANSPNCVSMCLRRNRSDLLSALAVMRVKQIKKMYLFIMERCRAISLLVPSIMPEHDDLLVKQLLVVNQVTYICRRVGAVMMGYNGGACLQYRMKCTVLVVGVNQFFDEANKHRRFVDQGIFEESTPCCVQMAELTDGVWVDLGL